MAILYAFLRYRPGRADGAVPRAKGVVVVRARSEAGAAGVHRMMAEAEGRRKEGIGEVRNKRVSSASLLPKILVERTHFLLMFPWAVCFEGSAAGVNAIETGNELSQPTLEFTPLLIWHG